jgi:elongation factor P hydroxylase
VHDYEDLIKIFNQCFLEKLNTQLLRGTDEPLYLPADNSLIHNTIFFAHGFFASALHECSHWFIAGEERRKQVDFGYWYVPDGRTAQEQETFLRVEVKPQAIEWILSLSANFVFRISLDNLHGEESSDEIFKQAVYQQVKTYCEHGLPERAERFRLALCQFYGTDPYLEFKNFDVNSL